MTESQATLVHNAQTEGVHAPKWLWELQPALSLGLSALSLVFAIMAYRRAGKRDYRVPIRDFIIAKINNVKVAAEEAKRLIEENLSGTNGGTVASHRNAAAALRNLETEVPQLENALPCRKEEIYRAWHTWQHVTTGGRYPVLRKSNLLNSGDAELVSVHTAHSNFLAFLSEIELGCLKEKIPFWKRIKIQHDSN